MSILYYNIILLAICQHFFKKNNRISRDQSNTTVAYDMARRKENQITQKEKWERNRYRETQQCTTKKSSEDIKEKIKNMYGHETHIVVLSQILFALKFTSLLLLLLSHV